MSEATQSNQNGKGGWVYFLAGFVGMLVLGWFIFPLILYSTESQPVNFSHKAHIADAGLLCDNCHGFREDGTFWGAPNMVSGNPEGQCVVCHEDADTPQGEDPREIEFLHNFVATGKKKIDWKIYSKQQPCVYFPHSVHVKGAELACIECHDDMEKVDVPRTYQANRLTGISRDIWGQNIGGFSKRAMKMGDCADCHTESGTSNACFVCHK
jgi:hypothetical protein